MNVLRQFFCLTSILISALFSVYSESLMADGGCVFDRGYYSIATYFSNPIVDKLSWIERAQVAKIITKNGSLVSIKHWTCDHLGLEAKEFVHPLSSDVGSDYRQLGLSLGALVLSKTDYDKLYAALGKRDITPADKQQSVRLDIQSAGYSEFYISYEFAAGILVITIKYYRD